MDTANIGRREDEEGPVEESEGEGLVTYDPETGKFHDPWKGPRRDENERRKLLSLHIIHTLEFWRDLPVPPEQAVREFFVHLAHDVDPSLEPGHRNLTAFMDAWRSK